MKLLKSKYAHICEYASSSNNKINILGIFSKIMSSNLPMTYSRFFIVSELEILKRENPKKILNQKLQVLLTGEKLKEPVSLAEGAVQITEPGKNINVIFEINNAIFPQEGNYEIQILLDKKILSSSSLSANIIPEIKPE